MKKLVIALALSIAISPVMAADEEQAMVVNIKRLSMEMAGKKWRTRPSTPAARKASVSA